jgi:hypothetical protein
MIWFEPLRIASRRCWFSKPWQHVCPLGLAAKIIDECFLTRDVEWKGPRHYANDRDHISSW